MGVEVLYKTQAELAADISAAIARVGFIDRGAKKRPVMPAARWPSWRTRSLRLYSLEICFVDSDADCVIYDERYDDIINNIACVFGEGEEKSRSRHRWWRAHCLQATRKLQVLRRTR